MNLIKQRLIKKATMCKKANDEYEFVDQLLTLSENTIRALCEKAMEKKFDDPQFIAPYDEKLEKQLEENGELYKESLIEEDDEFDDDDFAGINWNINDGDEYVYVDQEVSSPAEPVVCEGFSYDDLIEDIKEKNNSSYLTYMPDLKELVNDYMNL